MLCPIKHMASSMGKTKKASSIKREREAVESTDDNNPVHPRVPDSKPKRKNKPSAADQLRLVNGKQLKKKKKKEEKKEKKGNKGSRANSNATPVEQPDGGLKLEIEQKQKADNKASKPLERKKKQKESSKSSKGQAHENTADRKDVWWYRCRRFVLTCLQSECFEVVAKCLLTWELSEVQHMIQEWKAHDFAIVFGDWPAVRLAALLGLYNSDFIATACESWSEEQLLGIIPKLRTKVARQVLRKLFFKSRDPYLSIIDTKRILMAMPERKRRKLISKLKRKHVQRVLDADSDEEHSLDDRDDFGSDGDDYESDSFLVDDSDEEEEEEEEAQVSRRGGNPLEDSDVSF